MILSNHLECLRVVYIMLVDHDSSKFIPRIIRHPQHPEHPYIHKTRITKSTININKPSTDMAQNINMQYVFMQNARVLAPRQTDQLPPSSLQGAISMHRTNSGGRAISDHKLNMGFSQVQAEKKMYTEWWNCTKYQIIARGFAPAG